MHRTTKGFISIAAVGAFGLLGSACGSVDADGEASGTTPTVATSGDPDAAGDPTGDSAAEPDAVATEEDAVLAQLLELADAEAFAGDNSEDSIAAAVTAFNDAQLDFSPDGLAARIPADCSGIDTQTVSQILGVDVVAEDIEGILAASPGYLSCTLYAVSSPEVAMAYVHLAPDLDGWDNWGTVGTLEGAFDVAELGDAAVWSDGGAGDNITNQSMLQLQVDQGGTQSLLSAQASEPQLAIVQGWSVPKLILALAAVDASLT